MVLHSTVQQRKTGIAYDIAEFSKGFSDKNPQMQTCTKFKKKKSNAV